MSILATVFVNTIQVLWPEAERFHLWAVVPLVAAISIVYKGTRVRVLGELPLAAVKLSAQILVVMALAAGGLYGLTWAVHHWMS